MKERLNIKLKIVNKGNNERKIEEKEEQGWKKPRTIAGKIPRFMRIQEEKK